MTDCVRNKQKPSHCSSGEEQDVEGWGCEGLLQRLGWGFFAAIPQLLLRTKQQSDVVVLALPRCFWCAGDTWTTGFLGIGRRVILENCIS